MTQRLSVSDFRPARRALCLLAAAVLAACGGGNVGEDGQVREQPKLISLGSTPIPADAGTKGMWGAVANWPLIPLHAVLTADGRVLTFGTTETGKQTGFFIYDVWDPSQGLGASSHLTLPNQTATDIFCASAVQLPSGLGVSIVGGDNWTGTATLNTGNPNTTFFNPVDNSLARGNNMSRPRWYATSTVLLNGEILVQGGQGGADRADIRGLDGTFRQLSPDTSTYSWNYPRNFVAPDGRVFGFDVFGAMYYWNTAGTGTLTYAGGFSAPRGEDSTAAMFRPGKILQFGGSSNQAIVIDVTGSSPVVTPTQPLSTQRRWVTSTLLPDGKVLATGGSRIYNQLIDVNNSAEIWDPVSGNWSVGASGSLARLYHSMAMLLPDGSVLVGGGGAPGPLVNTNVEVYYPPYLFTGTGTLAPRPVLSGAPTVTDIGSTIWVDVNSTRPISRVTLIKTPSITHSFNNEQRFQDLTFSRQGNRLAVQMPTVAAHATPGHYMLFAIDDAGVPSEAPIIKINVASAANPAVTPVLAQPANQTSEAGIADLLALSASDPNGDVLTFSAAGLPAGLTLNSATGAISGTPTASGTFTVTVTASDGVNAASRTFTWTVTAATSSFTVALAADAPAPSSVVGATASFSAQAAGTGVQYSWNFGDGSAATAWSTSGTAQRAFAAPGTYAVTVSARDSAGRTAQLTFLQAVQRAPTAGAPAVSSGLAIESRSGGTHRVWMVNQDNNSVSVFDGATRARLAEIAVGTGPRSLALAADGRMWVTNKTSSTVTTIDTATLTVNGAFTLPQGSRPHGIVMSPDRSQAFIALEATGQVIKVSTSTLGTLGTLAVGPDPRNLSLDAAGTWLYVSRFVTPPQPGESTATVSSLRNGVKTGGEVVVVNASTLATARTIVLEHSTRPDTEASGRGVPNYLGAPVISPDGTQAWVPSKQDNIMRGLRRDGLPLDFQNTVRAIASRINLSTQVEEIAARVDLDNASLASAALYDPKGVYLFVALETSREIAVVDAHRGVQLFRFDAGRAPQSLAIAPDGLTLYVENFMDRTLGAFDLSPLVQAGQSTVSAYAPITSIATERLASAVLIGKQHFYDARDTRLARDRYMSCASCHSDAGHDGRVWDLSNLGEGLRRTISLRGKGADGGQGFRHWSGNFDETQDFEGQIRNLAGGTGLMSNTLFNAGTTAQPLGDAKAGKSADLDALAAYLGSLDVHDDSPSYAWTAVPQTVTDGKALFRDLNCATCHGGTAFTSSGNATLFNVGTLKATSGNRLGAALTGIDPPALRGLWAQSAYLHDGSATTIDAAIQAHNNLSVTPDQVSKLVAYLRTVGAQEPSAPANAGVAGSGLAASYFANTSLSGAPVVSRTEAVDFVWATVLGTAVPAPGVPSDNWSVRWTGAVQTPESGTYQFQVIADDGIRVWINGVAVINRWTGSGNTTTLSAPIISTAGASIPVVIEHFDGSGDSTVKLRWITPSATKYWIPVPLANLASSMPNTAPTVTLSGPANATRGTPVTLTASATDTDGSIAKVEFFDDGVLVGTRTSSPYAISWSPDTAGVHTLVARATDNLGATTNSNAVAVTATVPNVAPAVTITAPATATVGTAASLTATASDSDGTVSKVEFFDGTTLIATVTSSPYSASWTPTATGSRSLTARATDNSGTTSTSAAATVDVVAAPTAGGLRGSYFTNTSLSGSPVLVRKEAVTFVWASVLGTSIPGPGVPADNWSVRWSGWFQLPADGTYTLQIISDDGISVRINGQLVATRWAAGGNTTYTMLTTTGKAGDRYPIEIEHFDGTGDSTVKLRWQIPNSPYWWDVPAAQLLSN